MDENKWAEKMYERLVRESKKNNLIANYLTFLRSLKKRVEEKELDATIAVCGERGVGKSNFSTYSTMVLSHLLGRKFSFEEQIIVKYELKKAIAKITHSRMNVFSFDEAVDAAGSTEAFSRMGRFLQKVFTKIRKMGNVYFINLPKFWMLGKYWRVDLVNFQVYVITRGQNYSRAAFLVRDADPFNQDPWFLEWGYKKAKQRRSAVSVRDVFQIFRAHPTFQAFFSIPKLPEPVLTKYKQLSYQGIEKIQEDVKQFEEEKSKNYKDYISAKCKNIT